ncbi:MAG TPA: CU044_5270 family protein [Frankiaceae bacterium]|jgi:nucleotide-binding universal stress UspA family protein|nr:CU044_5270 family protein [Frankiaceae bacterium]
MTDDLLVRVAAADPAPHAAPLDDGARAAFATIVATPRSRRRARRARGDAAGRGGRVALVGALAAVAATAYLVVVPSRDAGLLWPTAYPAAATRREPLPYDAEGVPARPYLLALAERAEDQPRQPAGRYHYLRGRSEYLGRKNLPNGAIGGFDVTQQTEEWIGEHDGSGRVEDFEVVGEGGEDVERLPGRTNGPQPPGTFTAPFYWEPIPSDPAALRERLRIQEDTPQRRIGGGVPGQYFNGLYRVWTTKAIEPDESAALLRALADQPGILYRGGVTDRAGRRGVAFTLDTEPGTERHERRVLVLDEGTGAFLEFEEEARTGTDLPLDVPAPAVTSVTMLLANTRVDSTAVRP